MWSRTLTTVAILLSLGLLIGGTEATAAYSREEDKRGSSSEDAFRYERLSVRSNAKPQKSTFSTTFNAANPQSSRSHVLDSGCRLGEGYVETIFAIYCERPRGECDPRFVGNEIPIIDVRSGALGQPYRSREQGCDANPVSGGVVNWSAVVEREFAELPVEAAVAHLGPERGWIPVNMDVVVAADAREQELTRELLGVDVQIRAIPESYRFDFGDGTVVTTGFEGRPWPAKDIVSQYVHEGWYELSLVTTFRGEYSVGGGEFIPIDARIEVESQRHWVFADSLDSRLVSGAVDSKMRELPERSAQTLGPVREDAVVMRLERPGQRVYGN